MTAQQLFDSFLAKKLGRFVDLSPDELQCLAEIQSAPFTVLRGKQLIDEGQTGQKVFVLQKGWSFSYKFLPNGSRQIISFLIAGDCLGLPGMLLRTADRSVATLTDAIVSAVDVPRILKCVTEFPRLGMALLWSASRDEAIIAEHLVNVGRRTSLERTAHLLIELAERLSWIGLATKNEFHCPLNQFLIADALGLTAIHVNRTLRQLREENLATVRMGSVVIHDLKRLRQLAGYQSGYLGA